MTPAKDSGKSKGDDKKKTKSTPNKERQVSLRLSTKGAKRLNKLIEAKEWTVTQIFEEALKLYAAHEGIRITDSPDDTDYVSE